MRETIEDLQDQARDLGYTLWLDCFALLVGLLVVAVGVQGAGSLAEYLALAGVGIGWVVLIVRRATYDWRLYRCTSKLIEILREDERAAKAARHE